MLTGAASCLLKTLRMNGLKDWQIVAWGSLGLGRPGRGLVGYADVGGREWASELSRAF